MPTEQVSGQGSSEVHRYDLVKELMVRSGDYVNKDEDYLNMILESVRDIQLMDIRRHVMKRAGSTSYVSSVQSSPVRGMYYWTDQNLIMYAVNQSVYAYNVSNGTTTTMSYSSSTNIFSTSSGDVGFTSYLYQNGNVVIIVTDGTTLYQIDNTFTLTKCTDANMPVPHLPQPVFLDGYLNLVQANTANVYNSNSNNPLLWNASWFFTAEQQPGIIKRLCVIDNYLAVLTSNSVQYWWDAANATGSPYQLNPTPIKRINYIGGFTQQGNEVYFLGQPQDGPITLFQLKDFNVQEISIPTISRYLNTAVLTTPSNNWVGAMVTMQGHSFYVVNADGLTYVCDIKHNYWTRWAFQGNTNFNIGKAIRVTYSGLNTTVFSLASGDSTIYRFDTSLYQDNGVNFTASITTSRMEFNTMNNKFMARMTLVGDRSAQNSNMNISWTDDDYQTYSNPISVNLNQALPTVRQLGVFRQRAFLLSYSDNYPLRLLKLELAINKGNH